MATGTLKFCTLCKNHCPLSNPKCVEMLSDEVKKKCVVDEGDYCTLCKNHCELESPGCAKGKVALSHRIKEERWKLEGNYMNSNEEICELVAKERQCRVTHNIDGMAECYYEDAMVTTSWTAGKVPVGSYLYGGKAPVNDPECPIVSRISYPVVHRNGNRAYVEVPQTTLRWVHVNGEKAVLDYYMRLIYLVEKRVDEWKITDFRSIYESDMLIPEVPGTDLHLDQEKLAGLRHPYRYLAYVDDDVSPDLPGIDRPEEVAKLYEEFEQWIQEGQE